MNHFMTKYLRLSAVLICMLLLFNCSFVIYAYSSADINQTNVVSTSGNHVAVIDKNGDLWTWGSNQYGEIGNSGAGNGTATFIDTRYPMQTTPVKVLSNVVSVSCGRGFTAAIKADGSLWMWGENEYGELGNGRQFNTLAVTNERIQNVPVKVMDSIVAVSCGQSHIAAIKTDGTLWSWGHNQYGSVGNGGVSDSAGYNGKIAVQSVPVKIMDDVIGVSCGAFRTAALKSDGSVWAWGQGIQSDSLLGSANVVSPIKVKDNVKKILSTHTDSGFMYIDNNGNFGTLGEIFALKNASIPDTGLISVSGSAEAMAFIKNDNSLWMLGTEYYGVVGNGKSGQSRVSEPFKVMDDVVAVSRGSFNTIAVKRDGTVWTWGINKNGCIGNGGMGNATEDDGAIIQTVPYQVQGIVAKLPGIPSEPTANKPSSWAEADVTAAVSVGLVPDELQGDYTSEISRRAVVQMYIRLLEVCKGENIDTIMLHKGVEMSEKAFTDTYEREVLAANALGILNGVGDGRFDPNGTLTRAACAKIINCVAQVMDVNTNGYSHNFIDAKNHWSDSYLGWPSHEGIINGVGDDKFNPDGTLTTQEAIVIAYRAYKVLK